MRKNSIINISEIDPDVSLTFESKKYESFAVKVEDELRKHFSHADIWVIPEQQRTSPYGQLPSLRIIAPLQPKSTFNNLALAKAQQIVPFIYGVNDVSVLVDNVTLEDHSLKHVIDHLLSLQYGHDDYFTEFKRVGHTARVMMSIHDSYDLFTANVEKNREDKDTLSTRGSHVPNEVVLFVFEKVRQFRPELVFELSSATQPVNEPPEYASGYFPAPQ